ncbi:MAG: hypothetical protein FWG36_10280, partial [Oscillospiraceae bacterium]|nr:hypothetical protein [Oscillospiraceae bacterium]
ESLRFAVYCQKRRGDERGIPWGISESCFYAFDGALNYQYKAHGEPRLAYKRGLGHEQVISPYSSFLALMCAPKSAIANLKRMESLGLSGRYGFCEAADYTPARVSANSKFMPVKCFMSHHLGMSLLTIDNLLNADIMVSRFMSDPEMSAYSELLEEKVPTNGVTMKPRGREIPEKPARNVVTGWQREFNGANSSAPRCTLLSNGSYTLFCTDGGLTASTSGDISLTRFEPDAAKDGLGWYFYLGGDDFWASLTPLPAPHADIKYSAQFDLDNVSWKAHGSGDLEGLHTTVTARVPDVEGAEQRSVLLHNSGGTTLRFELFSYLEPVLSQAAHYDSHPAFSKLFLQSKFKDGCVIFNRRARGKQGGAYMAVACDSPDARFDASRELTLARGGASMLRYARAEHGTQGSVLDPCALIRVPVVLEPGASYVVTFSMAAAGTESDVTAAAIRTLSLEDGMASSAETMNMLGLTPTESHAALDWLSDLVFIGEPRQRQAYDITHNTQGQSGLWQWGISGDLPIVVAMGADAQPERLSKLLRQYRYLSLCGTQFDFVVLTQDGSDYRRPQRAHISETLKDIGCEGFLGARAGVHMVDTASMSSEDAYLLMSCASLVLDGQRPEPRRDAVSCRHTRLSATQSGAKPLVTRYLDDGSFQFEVNGLLPRASWGHTLANNAFGALIRDTGLGHIWRHNARENKYTPWDNDPLTIHGDETIRVIAGEYDVSPFADLDGFRCTVTYGFGYAVYEKELSGGVRLVTTVFVPPDTMARLIKIDVYGAESASLKHFTRLIMGSKRDDRRYIVTEKTRLSLTARNTRNILYSPQKAVLSSLPSPSGFTCDTNAWLDGNVSEQCGAGLDPCFGTTVDLMPQSEFLSAIIVFGAALNERGVALVENLADFERFGYELERTKAWWLKRVRPSVIAAPTAAMSHYLNGWAMYQIIANRLFARTSLYQCGGAYGFRDQLQDVCAVLHSAPEMAKNQILRACAHQFEEGDVQHWWHPARITDRTRSDRGVRTRISDDLLWLPYTVCEYIDKTGDSHILEYALPYLSSDPLDDDTHDRFEIPRVTEYRESVFQHCVRALERVITRGTGANGLLLMLGGDWNDGFDRVGAEGRGESTWLSWFASHVFERFAPLCNADYAQKLLDLSEQLSRAADNMWDGAWYKRGTFDDGTPLGSSQSDECQIDSIAQSFSALSRYASHTREALESAYERLVKGNVIQLFTPAFDTSNLNPGYIKGYLPGVRENGGQYTHAAVWLAMAHFLNGQHERGMELLEKLLPENHGDEYIVEPYVIAADVYSNPEHYGRGGWPHYTGAAAWYYRIALEALTADNEQLTVN